MKNPDTDEEGQTPVSELAGAVATGDSGGPAYVELDGEWYVAGINQSGTGETYGATSHFVRIAGIKDWVLEVFPGAKFGNEGE